MPTRTRKNADLVDFVRRTTEAITVMAESSKRLAENTEAIQNSISEQNMINAEGFATLKGKMEGLTMMFKYVIAPLVAGILALVGVKMIFNL